MLLDKLLSNLYVGVEPFSVCLVSTGWRLRLPGPPDVMLHFVLRGKGIVRGPDDRAHRLGPGWLVVVPKGVMHALESGDEVREERRIDPPPEGTPVPKNLVAGSFENPDLIVDCGLVHVRYGESIGLFDHLGEMLVIDLADSPQVRIAFEGIIAEQSQPGPGSEAMKAALMSQCLVHLLRSLCSDPSCPLPWLTALEDARLGRAIDQIFEEPGGRYTVDSLANLATMSRSAFTQHFTAAFGLPPMKLVHHIRMQRAANLLQQGEELSIDAVAHRVGFSSRSHFSRTFKRHYGVSPTELRAR